MDLDSIAFQQIIDGLYPIITGTGGAGLVIFMVIRFFGKRTFKSLVEEIVDEQYEDNLKLKVKNIIKNEFEGNFEEIKEQLSKDIENKIESHKIKCENKNLGINDNRYLLRKEFKVFMDSQKEQNNRVESAITDLRDVCNKILFKLNN